MNQQLGGSPNHGEYDNFGLFLQPSIIALHKKSLLYLYSVDFLHQKFIDKK
jgi:hypothetical protein